MLRNYGLVLLGWVILLAFAEVVSARGQVEPTNDRRLITNFGFTAIVLAAGALFPIAKLAASATAQSWDIGLSRAWHLPWAGLFVVAVVAETFAAYWIHRLSHATPLLWRIHRVHHADEQVDLSTSYRNHPLELAVTVPVSVAVIVIVGTPEFVVLAVQTLLACTTIWQHADIALPRRVELALSWVIFVPRLHRLHHNPERATHDSNYGELLTLWDRLFGTFNNAEGRRRVGLEGQVARPDRLLQQIWSPVYGA